VTAAADTVTRSLASVEARYRAFGVDGGIILVPFAIAVFNTDPDPLVVVVASQTLAFLYFVAFWSPLGGGRTIGMRLYHLRLVRSDGRPLTFLRALLRYIGLLLSEVTVIGALYWLVDDRRQGLHDKIADTLMVAE